MYFMTQPVNHVFSVQWSVVLCHVQSGHGQVGSDSNVDKCTSVRGVMTSYYVMPDSTSIQMAF